MLKRVNYFKKNNIKIYIMISFIIVIFTSCAISDIQTIAANSSSLSTPKWDLDFEILLINQTQDLSDYFSAQDIAAITTDPASRAVMEGLVQPVDITTTGDLSSASMAIDFDSDGDNDFEITSIDSNDGAGGITFTVKSDTNVIAVGEIAIGTVTLDGTNYNFNAGTGWGTDTVVFTSTDFLTTASPSHDFTGTNADQFDIDAFQLTFAASGKGDNLSYTFDIDFGNDYDIVGNLTENVSLYSISNQSTPLGGGTVGIDKFAIKMDTTSTMGFVPTVNANFTSGATNYDITSGGNTDISIPIGTRSQELTASTDIFSASDLTLSFDLILKTAANPVTITNNMKITLDLGISGEGEINLNF